MDRADHQVQDAVSDVIERLTGDAPVTMAGFAADSVAIFQVTRDKHGTPEIMEWTYPLLDGGLSAEEDNRWSGSLTSMTAFYRDVAPTLIVREPGQLPTQIHALLPDPSRPVQVHESRTPLRELLRAARRESRLRLDYELVVLRPAPPGTADGTRVVLAGIRLFGAGDTQGREARVQVHVEPTDTDGTYFAVVTREHRPDVPRLGRRMHPVQVQVAAALPPGPYDLTATLARPGKVRIDGLPVPLKDYDQPLEDLLRVRPRTVRAQLPAHLVCLVETSGGDDALMDRTHRLGELIRTAAAGAVLARVSVITYGPHGVAWKVPDLAPKVRAWRKPPDLAVNALRGLVSLPADEREYPRAAQLECALRLVREGLLPPHGHPADERPVIVAAGGRPPHPPELDTETQLIPCPNWVSAQAELEQLRTLPHVRFGAFRAPPYRHRAWDELGRNAMAATDDVVDIERFAADLGLITAPQTVPFPLTAPVVPPAMNAGA